MSKVEEKSISVSPQQPEPIIYRIIVISSMAISIITGLDETMEWLVRILGPISSKIIVYFNYIFLLPIAIVLITSYVIGRFTWKYRERIGTHGIPCALINVYYYKIANRHNKLLRSIHKNIYHNIYKLKNDISNHRIQSIAEANKGIDDLLYDIHVAIMRSFGLDLTISIKRLIMDRDNNLCLIPFKHFRNGKDRNVSNPRAFNYSYYIEPDEYERLSRYAAKARQYHNQQGENRKYEVNSVFTYLITKRMRYWMSNDVALDEKAGNFYTSSDNYPESYKSIAVFSLTPPESNILPEGLIIFDTKKKGAFSEEECVNLFGYIAHLLYELIIEYNRYERKIKQEKGKKH